MKKVEKKKNVKNFNIKGGKCRERVGRDTWKLHEEKVSELGRFSFFFFIKKGQIENLRWEFARKN